MCRFGVAVTRCKLRHVVIGSERWLVNGCLRAAG